MIALLQIASRAAGEAPPGSPSGYGLALAQTLLSLLGVSLLAWVVLRWAAKRGLGRGGPGRHIEVLERAPLDPRGALYLVRIGERILLLGRGEGAAPALLAELDPEELPALGPSSEPPGSSWLDMFSKKIQKKAHLAEELTDEAPSGTSGEAAGGEAAEGATDE